MFSKLVNVFKIPDLRKKILFTIMLLCIYRVGFHIHVPGTDNEVIQQQTSSRDSSSPLGRMAETMQMFTGGTLSRSSLFGLGIMPYISASIILMLLGEVWEPLKKLRQEGMQGQRKIQEYTRYLTVPLCVIQALMIMTWLRSMGGIYPGMEFSTTLLGVIGMTAGTLFLMWLGEQIDEYGIGNGISLLIMAGILSRMPGTVVQVAQNSTLQVGAIEGQYGPGKIMFIVAAFLFVVAGAILITQAQRRIPIQQARQMRGRRMVGGVRHYLPLRVNHGGVMPIIFASSLMMFPGIIIDQIAKIGTLGGSSFMMYLAGAFTPQAWTYNFVYIVMIFAFSYFWTTVQFQPKDLAKSLRDQGSFVPGLRPGHRTAEYLEKVMTRITFYGASFLAVIAVVPQLVTILMGVDWVVASFLGGTGLLIVVSVSLDLVQRIESQLVMHNYEGFSDSGKIKGARR
ncbi:preprotein translocase subunit SecY [Sedimentisphaera salicampi]|uniref:preprotein translocase subunit SecY n=1 Tax=Sedimentisphaera salicampi TaxID=1941349 RepID=UPI000B9A379A|nr:preprotein translocase subunit SecY [Sedimentisphaera salicampi]OXU14233.1 preprotein translocase subunit SecY [Sedimentisphaera salicampi]